MNDGDEDNNRGEYNDGEDNNLIDNNGEFIDNGVEGELKDNDVEGELKDNDGVLQRKFKKRKRFIRLNCRGTQTIISRDSCELIPYINSLINGPCENNPRDEKGNLIIDETSGSLFYLIDMYRAWLEGNHPETLSMSSVEIISGTRHYLYASIARRLGFEQEFVKAILTPKKTFSKEVDLFICFYCKNVYSYNEKKTYDECNYHGTNCDCRLSIRGCRRIPHHSPIKIKGACDPKN